MTTAADTEAARVLEQAGRRRAEAEAQLAEATEHVRWAVLAARRAGISVRRVAQLGGVAPSTVAAWEQADAEARGRRAAQLADQAADPARRGWYLADTYGTGQARVPAVAAVVHAAYRAVLADRPDLHPATAGGPAGLDRAAAELLATARPPGRHSGQAVQAAREVLARAIAAEGQQ